MKPESLSLELLDGSTVGVPAGQVPAFAADLRARGAAAVVVLDVVHPGGACLHWLESEHARGWLEHVDSRLRGNDEVPVTSAQTHTPGATAQAHTLVIPAQAGIHASGDASSPPPVDPRLRADAANGPDRAARFRHTFHQATTQGFVPADAAILASMALSGGAPALPRLSWSESPVFAPPRPTAATRPIALYALVETAARLRQVLDAGIHTVQMRIKTPAQPDATWREHLRAELAQGIDMARNAKAELFINDHWALASELGAPGVHLGQEDLQALGDDGRAKLLASGVGLGISSHSLWELCRARALSPRYIACGPVWPTTTKDMPWVPQGLDNLAWWCRMAGAPVVAIGGILQADQVRATAASGADGVCIVRGLGEDPARTVPPLREAFTTGRAAATSGSDAPAWPHPTLAVA